MSPKRNLETKVCCFCNLSEDDELKYGKFYEHKKISTHYYCLLLSSNMEQKGKDDEGILGFLAQDIQKELRRGKRLTCSYCKKSGATLGCCNVKCKRIFHYPCGLGAGSLHQFFGEFRSYCINHRPKQKIDDYILNEIDSSTHVSCYICYEDVEPGDFMGTLWAPCCKKDAWFHRGCVQQLALSAGYFFKCPLCNNKKDFQKAMKENGIFIPSQDASWELVPNAYDELLYRHNRCDAIVCQCPKGREHTSSNAKWELALCRTCGSQGIHMACGQLKWANPMWECPECTSILRKRKDGKEKDPESTDTCNSSCQNTDSDSDDNTDISVGTEFVMVTPLHSPSSSSSMIDSNIKLRPGPRSFKLQQQMKASADPLSTLELMNTDSKESSTTNEENNLTKNRRFSSDDERQSVSKKNDTRKDDDDDEDYVYNESDDDEDDDDDDDDEEVEEFRKVKRKKENTKKSNNSNNNDNIIVDDDDDDIKIIALKRASPRKVQIVQANIIDLVNDSLVNPKEATDKCAKSEVQALRRNKMFTNLSQDKASVSDLANLEKIINPILYKSCDNTSLVPTPGYVSSLKNNNFDDMADISPTSAMNIKIVNVTSLSPEVFASAPDVRCEKTDTCSRADSPVVSPADKPPRSRSVTPVLVTKRDMCKEVIDLEDNKHKRQKTDSPNEMFADIFAHNTIRTQVRSPKSAAESAEIRDINVDDIATTCIPIESESADPLSISPEKALLAPFTNNLQKSNEGSAQFLIQPNQIFFRIPSSDDYAEQIPIVTIEAKDDLPQDKRQSSTVVRDESIVNTQSVVPSIINLEDDTPEVLNEQTPEILHEQESKVLSVQVPEVSNVQVAEVSNAQASEVSNGQEPEVLNAQVPKESSIQTPEVSNAQAPEVSIAQASEVSNIQAAVVRHVEKRPNIVTTSFTNKLKRNLCDGDAGRTSPAVTRPTSEKTVEVDDCISGTAKTSETDASYRKGNSENRSCGRSFKRKTPPSENETVYTRTKSVSHFPSNSSNKTVFPRVTNNHNACHQPRLIPQYMCLHDLKFKIRGSDVQMILYDTFSVKISMDKFFREKKVISDIKTVQETKESTFSCQTCDEASSSFDCYDSTVNMNNDKIKQIADVVLYDDTKENLDPVMRTVTHNVSAEANLINNIDDIAIVNDYILENDNQVKCISSDTDLSASNRTICNITTDNNILDDVELFLSEQPVGDTSTSADEKIRLFCNKTIHCRNSDLNIANKNKSIEKSLRGDIAVSSNQHGDNKDTGNKSTDDSSMLSSNNFSYMTRNSRRLSGVHASSDCANVRSRIRDRKAANTSNITFNERISNRQITACDSTFAQSVSQMDILKHHTDDDIDYDIKSSLKVSIDLHRVDNLIRSKPDIFSSKSFRKNDDDDRCCKRIKRIIDDCTQQQLMMNNVKKYRNVRNNDVERALLKDNDLYASIHTSNVEMVQSRDCFKDATTFDRRRKQGQGSRYFNRHILNR